MISKIVSTTRNVDPIKNVTFLACFSCFIYEVYSFTSVTSVLEHDVCDVPLCKLNRSGMLTSNISSSTLKVLLVKASHEKS